MRQHLGASLGIVVGFIALLWGVELANAMVDHHLNAWGIVPRTAMGLVGIPLSPFLHAGSQHMMLNMMPLAVLGSLIALHGRRLFIEVSLIIIFLGGAGVWLFGRLAYHVGASGLIFGYFGYLVGRGWYERSILSILLALVTIFFYGGIIWGVVPTQTYVSWETHLFGLFAGVVAARLAKSRSRTQVVHT